MARRQSVSARALLVAGLLIISGCDVVGTDTPRVEASADPWTEMLDAVNEARAKGQTCGTEVYAPAGPLVWNDRLEAAATRHTEDMVRHESFAHTGTDGSDVGARATREGYAWRLVGENIARGQPSVSEVVGDWVKSPSHCRNLMDPRFAEMGAGEQNRYWTQVFGLAR
ncbi:MAG TPA: CAP domain-containing protein [Rubricoccaceae bacterium]|jgi:uncharacterized protein YkwD